MTIAASNRNEADAQLEIASITQGAYTVSWAANSDDARTEAEHAEALAQYFAQAVRTREPLNVLVHLGEDCPTATGDADICLRLLPDGVRSFVREVTIGGNPHDHIIELDLAWDDALARIARLLKAYLVERCQRDTFATWVRELPTSVVRSRLGLPNAATESTAA